jgi:hypothetical protein
MIKNACCKKCGSNLNTKGFCKDLTCPYSSWLQNVNENDLYEYSKEHIEKKYKTKKRVEK